MRAKKHYKAISYISSSLNVIYETEEYQLAFTITMYSEILVTLMYFKLNITKGKKLLTIFTEVIF